MRIALSGSTGYVGAHLARTLRERGHEVIPVVARATEESATWRLGGDADLRGAEVLLHCAHSFDDADANLRGTRVLYEAAVRDGASFIVFISSMAAFPGCRSVYGRTKLALEALTAAHGGLSIRPGTVWGGSSGGIMRALESLVRRLPVIPLIGSGAHPLYLAHIDDLAELVVQAIEQRAHLRARTVSAAHGHPVPFRDVLAISARRAGVRRVLMPFPEWLIALGLRTAAALGLRLPLRPDSLTSLLNANPDPDLTLPSCLRVSFREFC